jgi:hypothetical protein
VRLMDGLDLASTTESERFPMATVAFSNELFM